MFIQNEDKLFLVPFNGDKAIKALDSGVYNLEIDGNPFTGDMFIFEKTEMYENTTIINEGVFKKATDHIDDFFSEANDIVHKEMGLRKKSAVFYSGYPGTGKTFLAGQLANRIAKQYNAVGIIANKTISDFGRFIDGIRMNDPDRNIVLVIDEFDKTYDQGDMKHMLSFLDGKDSKSNVYIIFTMNKDGHIPPVLKERVGRIEQTFKFKPNEKSVLKVMISNVVPKSYKDKIDPSAVANTILMDEGVEHITIDLVKQRIVTLLRDIVKEELEKVRRESVKEGEPVNIQMNPN